MAVASSRLGVLGDDVSRLCDRLMNRFVRRVTGDATARVHLVDTPQVQIPATVVAVEIQGSVRGQHFQGQGQGQ